MVISQGHKNEYKPYIKIAEGVFDYRWGKESFVDSNGNETDLCSYALHRFKGGIPTKWELDKVILKSGRIPSMKDLKTFGEISKMTEEEMIPWMKGYLLKAIRKYDKSKNVEEFTINGVHMWLDSDLRRKVEENLSYCQQMGITETTLRYEGMAFPMSVEMGWQLYYAVLGYARETWDVTQIHESAVLNIDSVQGLLDYEDYYPTAYPKKLSF